MGIIKPFSPYFIMDSSISLWVYVLCAMTSLYYDDQYLTPYWAASPEVVRTAMVEVASAPVVSRGLAVEASVLVPLAVGALLLVLSKN